jgi:hypothetical protein
VIKQRHRAAGRKLGTIPSAELSRDADALIPELIPEAVAALTSLATTKRR